MSSMDFDFQIGKRTRLRGRGPRGLAALIIVLAAMIFGAWLAYPSIATGFGVVISHGTSALEKAWHSKAKPSVPNS